MPPISTTTTSYDSSSIEKIIGYTFKNKKLVEDSMTHSSFPGSVSYERLEFLGDPILGHAISNHLFLAYPNLQPAQLSLLRAANVSTEKLARVAVRHNLHRFLRHNSPPLIIKIVRGLLEPIITPGDLVQQPQPVTLLFEVCQKNGKQVDIKHWRNGAKSVASVHVDGHFVASASADQKDIARLDAAKAALHKLSNLVPTSTSLLDFCPGIDGNFEIDAAKQVLHELCGKKKWSKPEYFIENDAGPPHEKKFVCSVKIATEEGRFEMTGDEKSRVKDAENSAASLMIRALQESNYL
ncbi:PREDICTED: ribonuclease 3-like protein 2 isoform X2 [Lupinus angustifolius]|uniref:ribonuclease 3-like protein 2 isoform X2 n=1 Tax=Lupinus angustifolius TaxID=3871 RepID=UPI00092EA1AF|nr:PREDICTED: ribonuclease 3-like protein 2 isoform X2 [Lupinus angustifolius]